jgi:hypothetical protein
MQSLFASLRTCGAQGRRTLFLMSGKLERRTLRLNRGDSGESWFVIRFRREVIRDAEALFA